MSRINKSTEGAGYLTSVNTEQSIVPSDQPLFAGRGDDQVFEVLDWLQFSSDESLKDDPDGRSYISR